MFSRVCSIALPGIAAATSFGFWYRDDLKVLAATLVTDDTVSATSSSPNTAAQLSKASYYDPDFPSKPWNHNWD